MIWIRTHIRSAAHVALFALALQLALSFGHVHVDQERLAAAASETSVTAGGDHPPTGPADHHHTGDDVCAICATIALAGSLVIPATPALPLPLLLESVWSAAADASPSFRSAQLSFQARAPPV